MVTAAPATTASTPATTTNNHHAGRLPPMVCADDANTRDASLWPTSLRARNAPADAAAPIATTISPPIRRNGPRAASSATAIASRARPIAENAGATSWPVTLTCCRAPPAAPTVAAPQVRPDANSSNAPASAVIVTVTSGPRFIETSPAGGPQGARGGDCAQHRGRLVAALGVLACRVGVGDDARTGLHVRTPATQHQGADGDSGVHVATDIEVADDSAVDAASSRFERLDDLHRAHLRCAGQRAGGEARAGHVQRGQLRADGTD